MIQSSKGGGKSRSTWWKRRDGCGNWFWRRDWKGRDVIVMVELFWSRFGKRGEGWWHPLGGRDYGFEHHVHDSHHADPLEISGSLTHLCSSGHYLPFVLILARRQRWGDRTMQIALWDDVEVMGATARLDLSPWRIRYSFNRTLEHLEKRCMGLEMERTWDDLTAVQAHTTIPP